jgi:hypothetical protein
VPELELDPEELLDPEVLPDDELVSVVLLVVVVTESFLQASTSTDVDTAPIIRLFKKFLRSMILFI